MHCLKSKLVAIAICLWLTNGLDCSGFRCQTGECILQSKRCDGHRDCPKLGEDEWDCSGCQASANKFICDPTNGPCLSQNRCNIHEPSCPNHADTINCPTVCAFGGFVCQTSRRCIPNDKRCDCVSDCSDGSDERNCADCRWYEIPPIQLGTSPITFGVLKNRRDIFFKITGPSNVWFGVGFGTQMLNSDAIIYSSGKDAANPGPLTFADYWLTSKNIDKSGVNPDANASPSIELQRILSVRDLGSNRVEAVIRRPLNTNDPQDYTFGAGEGSFPLIWAVGSSLTIGYHASRSQGSISMVFQASTSVDPLSGFLPASSATSSPSIGPTTTTNGPSGSPTIRPSASPTTTTLQPTTSPSNRPSSSPTLSPSDRPSLSPTVNPSIRPTTVPSKSPSMPPTKTPSTFPSQSPSKRPTSNPATSPPTKQPTLSPSHPPTVTPTSNPTGTLSNNPTVSPTDRPTTGPTVRPSGSPTDTPSFSPTISPTTSPMHQRTTSITSTTTTTTTTASPSTGFPTTNSPTSGPSTSPGHRRTNRPTTSPLTTTSTASTTTTATTSATTTTTATMSTSTSTMRPTIQQTMRSTNTGAWWNDNNGHRGGRRICRSSRSWRSSRRTNKNTQRIWWSEGGSGNTGSSWWASSDKSMNRVTYTPDGGRRDWIVCRARPETWRTP